MAAKKSRTKRSTIAHFPMARTEATQAVYNEFGRRLQRAMANKGWSQSELARRANTMLPPPTPGQKQGLEFRRDLVSHYITGRHIPGAANLAALAKALGVDAGDLLPQGGLPDDAPPPFAMTTLSDGRVNLRVNRTVSAETARKIWALIQHEDK